MINIGTDIQGLSEMNRPWTHTNKWKYDFMMELIFQQARTIYVSSPKDQLTKYQPGGSLLSITGYNVGRINKTGQDPMGQFAWSMMRGKHDEGILIIVAYRVCQDQNSKAGAFTAYQQQCTALHAQGLKKPNPRQQVLTNLAHLITTKHNEGFHPMLMMDANRDTHHPNTPDLGLREFIDTTNLVNMYYKNSRSQPGLSCGEQSV